MVAVVFSACRAADATPRLLLQVTNATEPEDDNTDNKIVSGAVVNRTADPSKYAFVVHLAWFGGRMRAGRCGGRGVFA